MFLNELTWLVRTIVNFPTATDGGSCISQKAKTDFIMHADGTCISFRMGWVVGISSTDYSRVLVLRRKIPSCVCVRRGLFIKDPSSYLCDFLFPNVWNSHDQNSLVTLFEADILYNGASNKAVYI